MSASLQEKVIAAFLWSVGVLFSVTALLKVIALVQGRHLAMRPDPVFWFVSARLTSVLAVCVESAVLALIVSRASTRFKLAMLVWVAGLLLIYRVMWSQAVPSSEPCPCFGLFWQQLGVKAVVGNMASFAILIYAATFSLVFLLWVHLRPNAIPPPDPAHRGHENSAATARKTLSLPILLLIFSLSAPLLANPVAAVTPDAAPLRLDAEGDVEVAYVLKKSREHLKFQVEVSGLKTAIWIYGGFANNDILTNAFFYDGHLGCSLIVFSPDRRGPSVRIDPETGKPSWDTNNLVRPLNDATLTLRESPIPLSARQLALWLAFGCSPYLEHWESGKMEKLFDLGRTRRRAPLRVPGVLQRFAKRPHLPELLMTFDGKQRSFTNELFRVLEWRTTNELSLPVRFEFQIFESHHEPRGKLLTIIQCSVTGFHFPTNDISGRPVVCGRVDVMDERFAHDAVPLPVVNYWTTNANIPEMSLVRSNRSYRAQVEIERSQMRRKPDASWYFLFLALVFAPVGWFIWRGWITARTNK
jgi:hypothetical protein